MPRTLRRSSRSPESPLAADILKVKGRLPKRRLLTRLPFVSIATSSIFGYKNPFRKESTPKDNNVWLLDATAFKSDNPTPDALEQWQAEFVACHFGKGRKDIADIASYFVDFLGVDGQMGSDAEARERIEQRLYFILSQIAPAHTIKVLIPRDAGKPPLERMLGPSNNNGISSQVFPLGGIDASNGQTLDDTSPVFRNVSMSLRFAAAEGWAVMSDIDDTIKFTGTTEPTWLLRSLLADIPEPTEGMPELYHMLDKELDNPVWFYVSASPYNLYPVMREFVNSTYPPGTILLRDSSMMSVPGLLKSFTVGVQKYKVEQANKIHGWLPRRQFICFGDSTQADPESYAELYHENPGWIKAIYIRTPTALPHMEWKNSPERFAKAFKGIPESVWMTFVAPGALTDHLKSAVGLAGSRWAGEKRL